MTRKDGIGKEISFDILKCYKMLYETMRHEKNK